MINKSEKFHYNPFAGVHHDDIDKIIVPRFKLKELMDEIRGNSFGHVEFKGKKGRGKTTHLIWLHSHLNQYPIYLLDGNSNEEELLNDPSEVLFIDSIHHLSVRTRIKLFRSKKTIIYTTHLSRRAELKLAGQKVKVIRFKGIDEDTLTSILKKRLLLASVGPSQSYDLINSTTVTSLIRSFGDDYRGIINGLYDQYQNK